jgi:hypothetical protein
VRRLRNGSVRFAGDGAPPDPIAAVESYQGVGALIDFAGGLAVEIAVQKSWSSWWSPGSRRSST